MKKVVILLSVAIFISFITTVVVAFSFIPYDTDYFGMKAEVQGEVPSIFIPYDTDYFGMKVEVQGEEPSIIDVSPANASFENDMCPLLLLTVNELQDQNFNISWSTNATDSWVYYNSTCTDGTFSQRATFANASNTTYWFTVQVNDTDGHWTNATYHFTTANYSWGNWSNWWKFSFLGGVPQISNVTPINGNVSVLPGSITLSALFNDSDGDNMNISWYWDDNSSLISSNLTVANGTYQQIISVVYQQIVNWSIHVNDSVNWNNISYSFTVIDLNPVTNLVVANYNSSSINLTWSKNSNVSNSYIRYKIDSTPSSLTDGTFTVNTTNTSYNHTNLNYGSHYYYSIWSYNSTNNVFSNSYTTGNGYTNPGGPSSLQETSTEMDSISLTWDEGENATRSVVYINGSGNASYPNRTNGEEAINTTENTGTINSLINNVTYWFSAYSFNPDSGLWSESNSTDNASTVPAAGSVTNLLVSRYNDVQLNLSWSKANPDNDVVVLRKTGSYPTNTSDGTEVYNGSQLSYKNTGLTPITKYYYRAWAWNGEEHGTSYSSNSNITRPSPPEDFTGNIDDNNLIITWSKPASAARTLIRNNTGDYPVNVSDGYFVYNDTGETTTVVGVSGIDYYRAWSYKVVESEGIYSLYSNLLWGGIEINVYNEGNTSQAISGYNVFIKNADGSQTYQDYSCTNPHRIDVSDCPNGDDMAIQISASGYESRTYYMDLYENEWYSLTAYLPVAMPPGGIEDPTYDPTNETYSNLYLITVVGPQGEYTSQPVEDVKVNFQKYINATGEFSSISILYTDANGQVEIYLYVGDLYQVTLSKDGYTTRIENYIPSDSIFTHTFRIYPEAIEPPVCDLLDDFLTFTGEMFAIKTIKITYADSNESTTNTQIYLYSVYNDTYTLNDTDSRAGSNSFSYYVPNINTSRTHYAWLYFNNTANFCNSGPIMITIWPELPEKDPFSFDDRVTPIFGPFVINDALIS